MESYVKNKQKDTSHHDVPKEKINPNIQPPDTININNKEGHNQNVQRTDNQAPTAPQPIESRIQSTNSAYNNREPNTQRFNFASAECGAKVLRSNIEARVRALDTLI